MTNEERKVLTIKRFMVALEKLQALKAVQPEDNPIKTMTTEQYEVLGKLEGKLESFALSHPLEYKEAEKQFEEQ